MRRWRTYSNFSEKNEPILLGQSQILTAEVIAGLESSLPKPLKGYNWKLLYSLEEHGASFQTFFSKTQYDANTVLLIETARKEIIGGFTATKWKPSLEYYGTGENFLFVVEPVDDAVLTEQFGPPPVVRPIKGGGGREARGSVVDVVTDTGEQLVRKFAWTGANAYFMLCTDSSLAMGGGGSWGLYVDDDMSRGSTGPSDTYGNKPLCATGEFDIVNLECWGFTTAHSVAALSQMRRPLR